MKFGFLVAAAIVASVPALSANAADDMHVANNANNPCLRGSEGDQPCTGAAAREASGATQEYGSRTDGLPMQSRSTMSPNPPSSRASAYRTVTTGSNRLAAGDIVGRPVVTPSGRRFGEVTAIQGQQPANEDLVIRVDKPHRARSLTLRDRETSVPMISGDGTAVVREDQVRLSADGRSIVVGRSSLRPIGSRQS